VVVRGYDSVNRERLYDVTTDSTTVTGSNCDSYISIPMQNRVLIPTGLIFDIPEGYSVRLHSRSGLAWNEGLYLTNCEGIIDSDYVDPIFVMMTSISQSPKVINNGDRICQAELVKKIYHGLTEIKKPPVQKTEREGGFGSTGK